MTNVLCVSDKKSIDIYSAIIIYEQTTNIVMQFFIIIITIVGIKFCKNTNDIVDQLMFA